MSNHLHNAPERIAQLQTLMKAQNLDVLIATSPANFTYASGIIIPSQVNIPDRLAFAVIPVSGAPLLLVCGIERGIAEAQNSALCISTYTEEHDEPFYKLRQLLDAHGLNHGRLGIEEKSLAMGFGRLLKSHLSHFTIVAADQVFDESRFSKTPYEVDNLEHGAKQTQKAIRAALDSFQVGMTELELYRELSKNLLDMGSAGIVSLTCCAGERTAILHAEPTNRKIQSGEAIKIDIHGRFNGYLSDIARMAYAGDPRPEIIENYRTFWQLHKEILALPKVGMKVGEFVQRIKVLYEEAGFGYTVPHMGHSFGLGLHEAPLLTEFSSTKLQPGTTLSVEPRALNPVGDRYHLEDPVLITDAGPKVLSAPEDFEFYIGIG